MKSITFIDIEVSLDANRIVDYGAINLNGETLHVLAPQAFYTFLKGTQFLCGHNLIEHDIKFLKESIAGEADGILNVMNAIDTLYLSPLMFPKRPYHALLKDDKLQVDELNNPLNDAKKARDLFFDEVEAFRTLPARLRGIYYALLNDKAGYHAFFQYIDYEENAADIDKTDTEVTDIKTTDIKTMDIKAIDIKATAIEATGDVADVKIVPYFQALQKNETGNFLRTEPKPNTSMIEHEIKEFFQSKICDNADIKKMIENHPIELAYCLSLIHIDDEYSITPRWVLMKYPKVDILMHNLCSTPCMKRCVYCMERLDIHKGLKRFFGYDNYRDFDGIPLQEQAVKAAVDGKSLLAVFPTGGGKSITFQVPALMAGKNTKGLTVVISPLQSLMKDQVDNLENISITDAVTINGLLDPIERAEAFRRVEDGEASIFYISPESLRSKSIERLLLGRKISRFVIDEAHCFSAWGQDFRVDYLYIAEFIKNLNNKKSIEGITPVSCFTATAKQEVIEDIRAYFKDNLNLDLELYTASASRKNLTYTVIEKNEKEKYDAVRDLLEYKKCPTIIYASRTKRTEELAERLSKDGYLAKAYHGKMDKKVKSENQDAFIRGQVNIIVATSAFGMGVDKKDVEMVIHYDISDTLENYVQEAGRAGRDQSISAECFVLFNDEDLNKHFLLLNQTKISMSEIQQVWKAIKDATRTRARMSNSVLEIARQAGWVETANEIETRVKTAVAALEDAGYIKRGQNMPKVYADSIQAKSAMEAIEKVQKAGIFNQKEEEQATRIIKKLISSRSRKHAQNETPESRIDYISDDLGIAKNQVIHIIQMLREAGILADAKDLTAYMDDSTLSRSMNIYNTFKELEQFLLNEISEECKILNIKELNEQAETKGVKKASPDKIRIIMNFWAIKGMMRREVSPHSRNHVKAALLKDKAKVLAILEKRFDIAEFILSYLNDNNGNRNAKGTEHNTIEFSILELMAAYEFDKQLFQKKATAYEVEDTLFYLSRIGVLKLEGGFLITYNALSIERIEMDNKIRYKVEDYKNLKRYYENKTQMIHIVGEYAKKMMEDYSSALQFVDDYFQLEYSSFLRKYFKGTRDDEIRRNLSPEKFKKLFGELSPAQLKIINDKDTQRIVVAAGPGSGKTRILVHKLASLLLMEDIKHEQLLMLTFSRAAATEFKKRLLALIGNAASFVEIKTFHGYCFDLLGRVGSISKSSDIIKEAVMHIENGDVEISKITKAVLVIDESQDIDEHEYRLVKALMNKNDGIRVIAVGDDDQNIFSFRGSDSRYMRMFLDGKNARLVDNDNLRLIDSYNAGLVDNDKLRLIDSYNARLIDNKNAKLYELIENYRSKANLVYFTNIFANTMKERMKKRHIMPVQGDNGSIKVVQYKCNQLILPVINKIIDKGIKGSTCVMTRTNEEALQAVSLLSKNGVRAKLIQSNERYAMYDLLEMRYFLKMLDLTDETYILSDEMWEYAKGQLKKRFIRSKDLLVCERLIRDFEETTRYEIDEEHTKHSTKYTSDLILFMEESVEEDFYIEYQGGISVSTIHKSKGREFDNVVIILSDYNLNTEEAKRQLYVGMTRAKKSLEIHYNGQDFSVQQDSRYKEIENVNLELDYSEYEASNVITLQLGYKDVYLSYFAKLQRAVAELMSGDVLEADEKGCLNQKGNRVLLFSDKFREVIKGYWSKGYRFSMAKVNHVLYWKEEEKSAANYQTMPKDMYKDEIMIVLPEIELVKEDT